MNKNKIISVLLDQIYDLSEMEKKINEFKRKTGEEAKVIVLPFDFKFLGVNVVMTNATDRMQVVGKRGRTEDLLINKHSSRSKSLFLDLLNTIQRSPFKDDKRCVRCGANESQLPELEICVECEEVMKIEETNEKNDARD